MDSAAVARHAYAPAMFGCGVGIHPHYHCCHRGTFGFIEEEVANSLSLCRVRKTNRPWTG